MSEQYFNFEDNLVSCIDAEFYVNQLDAEVLELIQTEYGSVDAYVKEYLCKSDNQEDICRLFERLSYCKPREQLFICQRFGLIDGKAKTLDEIVKMFGITRDRARQIERKCLRPGCRLKRRKRLIDFLNDQTKNIMIALALEENTSGAFYLEEKEMSNEENIPVITASELRTRLQELGDHVILTIVLEGDDEEDAKE